MLQVMWAWNEVTQFGLGRTGAGCYSKPFLSAQIRTLMLQLFSNQSTAILEPQCCVICPSDDVFQRMLVLGTEKQQFYGSHTALKKTLSGKWCHTLLHDHNVGCGKL